MSKQKFTVSDGFEFATSIAMKPMDTLSISPDVMSIEYSTMTRTFACRPLSDALRDSMNAALAMKPFYKRVVFIGTADMCREMLEVIR